MAIAFQQDAFQKDAFEPVPGVIHTRVGAHTPTSFQVVGKHSLASNARLRVATSADLNTNAFYTPLVAIDANGMVKITVTGLTSNTVYYFAWELDGVLYTAGGTRGRCKTASQGAHSFSFAAASCSNSGTNNPVFASIRNKVPELFIQMGDMHYDNVDSTDPKPYRDSWDTVLKSARQKSLYSEIPHAYTWDDHDFCGNGSHAGSIGATTVPAVYRDYFPHYPLAQAASTEGIYHTFEIGRVRFIVLDLRRYRNESRNVDDANKTMLGATQKQWFKDLLVANKDQVKFVVSSVPWVSDKTLEDGWGAYQTERTELGNFFAANAIKNVVMLSGDMHGAAMDDGTNSVGGWKALQAAPLDKPSNIQGGPYTQGPVPSTDGVGGINYFGWVDVTDTGGTITVTMNVLDANNANAKLLTDMTFTMDVGVAPTINRTAVTHLLKVAHLANRVRNLSRNISSFLRKKQGSSTRLTKLFRSAVSYTRSITQVANRAKGKFVTALSYVRPLVATANSVKKLFRSISSYTGKVQNTANRFTQRLRSGVSYAKNITQIASGIKGKVRSALTHITRSTHVGLRVLTLYRVVASYMTTRQLSSRVRKLLRTGISYLRSMVQVANRRISRVRSIATHLLRSTQTGSRILRRLRAATSYTRNLVQVASRQYSRIRVALTHLRTSTQASVRLKAAPRAVATYLRITEVANRTTQLFKTANSFTRVIWQTASQSLANAITRSAVTTLNRITALATTTRKAFRTLSSNVRPVMQVARRVHTIVRIVQSYLALIRTVGNRQVHRLRSVLTWITSEQAARRVLARFATITSYVAKSYHAATRRSSLFRAITSIVKPVAQLANVSIARFLARTATTFARSILGTSGVSKKAFRTLSNYLRPTRQQASRFFSFIRTGVSYLVRPFHTSNRVLGAVRKGTSYIRRANSFANRQSKLFRNITSSVRTVVQRASGSSAAVMLRSALTYLRTRQAASRLAKLSRAVTGFTASIRNLVNRFTRLFRTPTTSTDVENLSNVSTSRPRTAQTHMTTVRQASTGVVNIYTPPNLLPIVQLETMQKKVSLEVRRGQVSLESVKKPVELTVTEGSIH